MNPRGKAVENLLAARAVLHEHGSPELVAWFDGGVDAYLGHGADIAKTLGLSRRARKVHILQHRNAFMRQALALCLGETGPKKARRLHLAIENFRDNIWPTARRHDSPPENMWRKDQRALLSVLFWVFRTSLDEPVPGTQRGVEMICEMKTENHFEAHAQNAFVESTPPTARRCVDTEPKRE